jgi:LysR family transcriptional regulator, cyn operon transcriptional activator
MNNQIDIRHLKCFLAAAEELQITRAAQRLGISQPTLSQTIRELERKIGMPLFDRVGRRIQLTTAGKSLKVSASRIIQDVNRTFDVISDLRGGHSGVLRIGSVPVLSETILPPLIAAYHREFPHVRLVIENSTSPLIEERLLAGALDFGVTFGAIDSDELISEPLYTEPFVLACNRSHPMAKKKHIRLAEVLDQSLAITTMDFFNRRLLESEARRMGKKLQVAVECSDVGILLEVVRQSRMITVIPAQAGREYRALATVPITDPAISYKVRLIWHRDQYRTAAARLFAERLKSSLLSQAARYSPATGKKKRRPAPTGRPPIEPD